MNTKEEQVKEKLDSLKKAGKVIFLKEKVTVKATGSHPYYKEGKEVELHPDIAAKGIKDGFYTPVKKAKE